MGGNKSVERSKYANSNEGPPTRSRLSFHEPYSSSNILSMLKYTSPSIVKVYMMSVCLFVSFHFISCHFVLAKNHTPPIIEQNTLIHVVGTLCQNIAAVIINDEASMTTNLSERMW